MSLWRHGIGAGKVISVIVPRLRCLGAPWIARKMAANATPTVILTRVSDTVINIKTVQTIGGDDKTFTLGELTDFQPQMGPLMQVC